MLAKQDEVARRQREANCGHRKPDNQEASATQEFSDGMVRVFCLRCQKVLRTYLTPAMAQALSIRQRMAALNISEEELEDRIMQGKVGMTTDELDQMQQDLHPDPFARTKKGTIRNVQTTENQYQ